MSKNVRSGDIVHYSLTDMDRRIVGDRTFIPMEVGGGTRFPLNMTVEGQYYPMIVVVVHEDGSVNGQVFIDGAMTHWATSVVEGEGVGQWLTEAPREKGAQEDASDTS